MYRYNANTGDLPQLGDRVEVVLSGGPDDGIKGTIGGWGSEDIALIALDIPKDDGCTIAAWPVVCLKKLESFPGWNTFQEAFDAVIDDGSTLT